MTGAGHLLGRLRRLSAAELKDRLRQSLSARAERLGFGAPLGLGSSPLGRILAATEPPNPESLLARFRDHGGPRSFGGLDDPRASAALVQESWPAESASLIARAEKIASGSFDLMGHRDLDFGNPVDWQLDPIAGRRAPFVHWSRVPYLDASRVGDHKVVWELNRQQWLVTLGQAYALTGDERWAAQMVHLIDSWLDANPPKLGINWASSLEVAFRAISWLWALRYLRQSPALEPRLYGRLLESLQVHGRHLETYLSTWFSPNTHLTGEALGLLYLGTLVPELEAAPRWQKLGLSILETQLPIQVHPDGVYFEQATQYHRYTADFYTHLVLLAEANRIELAPHVRPTLERLLEHLLHLARPDGTIPLFGDDDGGRLVQLDTRTPDDVRALLATGAVIFNRPDFAFGARGDITAMVWLLGTEGLRRFEALTPTAPAELARAFRDGGYYVSRDSWKSDASWLAIDAGPHGAMNCGHAHADALSFELEIAGRPVFVDAGTYSYPGPERDAFREAAAHNAVVIDGQSSSRPAGPFQWASVAAGNVEHWHTSPRATFVAGSHDGYLALPSPTRHQRAALHLIGEYFVLRDRIESEGQHEIAVRFHCAPGLQVGVPVGRNDTAVAEIVDGEGGETILRMSIFGHHGRLERQGGWVSPQYGRLEKADVVVWKQDGTGTQDVVTFLIPSHLQPVSDVAELSDVQGGRAFRVTRRGGEDLLLVGDGSSLDGHGVQTDAEWLWIRRDSAGLILDYIALGASHARVAGLDLWPVGEQLEWRTFGGAGVPQGAMIVDSATSLSDTGPGVH